MRAVVQRVKKASVKIQNTSDGDYINGEIDKGLLVFWELPMKIMIKT